MPSVRPSFRPSVSAGLVRPHPSPRLLLSASVRFYACLRGSRLGDGSTSRACLLVCDLCHMSPTFPPALSPSPTTSFRLNTTQRGLLERFGSSSPYGSLLDTDRCVRIRIRVHICCRASTVLWGRAFSLVSPGMSPLPSVRRDLHG